MSARRCTYAPGCPCPPRRRWEFQPEFWLGLREWGRWASLSLLPDLHVGWGTTYDSVHRTGQRYWWVHVGWLSARFELHANGPERDELYTEDWK